MSKYEPLKRHLAETAGSEAPMTFRELESILGFKLPASARNYAAWWSNNVGTHVNAAAWRAAGWKTSSLDLGSERVTFVRENALERPPVQMFTQEMPTAHGGFAEEAAGSLFDHIAPSARRMVEDWAEECGVNRETAMAEILNSVAKVRRRQLVETLPFANMPAGHDSTALIREDRDDR